MKKIGETVLGIIAFVLFVVVVGRVGYWDTHYTEDVKVTYVFTFLDEKTVTVENAKGEEWTIPVEFDTKVEIGQKARVYIFDNETTRASDDKVENIKFLKK